MYMSRLILTGRRIMSSLWTRLLYNRIQWQKCVLFLSIACFSFKELHVFIRLPLTSLQRRIRNGRMKGTSDTKTTTKGQPTHWNILSVHLIKRISLKNTFLHTATHFNVSTYISVLLDCKIFPSYRPHFVCTMANTSQMCLVAILILISFTGHDYRQCN